MIFSGHANKDGAVENFTNFEPEKNDADGYGHSCD